jgi:hypothetical protein
MDIRKKSPTATPAPAVRPGRKNQLDNEGDVSAEERALLARSANNPPDEDERAVHEASLDESDEDGTPLEEKGLDQDPTGSDLDIPGAEEGIGDEDEDNND